MDTEPGLDASRPMGCVGFRVRRTSRALTSFYNARLRPTGIRITQWPILAALRETGALTVSELADLLGTDPSTVSRSVQPLVREGLVDLTEDGDARRRYARLTARGVTTYRDAYRLWEEAQRELLERLGPDWEAMQEKLRELEEAVR